MESILRDRPRWLTPVSVFAILFGLLTIKEGGAVLFIDGAARKAAGNYVPFVLWFNFSAGFFYIAAGIGLWRMRLWSARLAALIAALTLLVFTVFGVHAFRGGAYELRTVMAMTLRSLVWLAISYAANRFFSPRVKV
ncbi:MAG: hypothetical protein A2V87_03840 [Deltaproteobacteria bacterium RBG_16_58_17]|nr:MAG: hypothetical protein A2V87_03840 [Deltaproteobacteria bacterium RBG_16_58_17]OHE20644.1 MAG: hypothetical protein A2X95_05535 [Syntrophobacterales bacterium GWF2_56_9]